MFFGLKHLESDNPGNAFSVSVAQCIPISQLGEQMPEVKETLQASENNYNAMVALDEAKMEHFAGLVRLVFWTPGCVYMKHTAMRHDPKTPVDLMEHANWLTALQRIVSSGIVGKEEGHAISVGKIVKQGSRWKWAPITDPR